MTSERKIGVREVTVSSKDYINDLEEEAPDGYDFLDIDKPIRGQGWCLLSFMEPPISSLEKLENYVMCEFMKSFLTDYTKRVITQISNDYKLNSDELIEKYKLEKKIDPEQIFDDKNWEEIKKELENSCVENHFFQSDIYDMLVKYRKFKDEDITELRNKLKKIYPTECFRGGVKFRGAFPSRNRANKFATELFKMDKVANIFAVQSGAWVPFNPSEDEIKKQRTNEKELNNIMWQYRKNQMHAEQFFNKRKEDLIKDKMKKNLNNRIINKKTHTLDDSPPKLKYNDDLKETEQLLPDEKIDSLLDKLEKLR